MSLLSLGANPIDVLIEFPKGASLYAPDTLKTIAEVHAMVEKSAGVGNVWSLETLRRWLAEKAGSSDVETLKQYVSVIPEHLVRRFVELAAAGLGLLFVSGRVIQEVSEVFFAVGVLALAVGVGFVVSAAASLLLSQRLGLLGAGSAREHSGTTGV